jgi:hypothetical protein
MNEEENNFDKTIEDIRTGFNEWRFHNEESVKQGIILPILQSLGWNIFDTREVYPEHNIVGKSADYVLYQGDKPTLLIEAKALGRSQNSIKNDKKQVKEYIISLDIKKVIITDGLYWRFYNKVDNDVRHRLIEEINILKDEDFNKFKELLLRNTESWDKFIPIGGEKKPVSLTLYDDFTGLSVRIIIKNFFDEKFLYKNWNKGYEKLCQQLYNKDSNKMQSLTKEPKFEFKKKKSFDDNTKNYNRNKNHNRNYVTVNKKGEKIYADADMGNNGYAKMIRELFRYYEILANEIEITKIDKKK